MNSDWSNCISLKYHRFISTECKDMGVKFWFCGKNSISFNNKNGFYMQVCTMSYDARLSINYNFCPPSTTIERYLRLRPRNFQLSFLDKRFTVYRKFDTFLTNFWMPEEFSACIVFELNCFDLYNFISQFFFYAWIFLLENCVWKRKIFRSVSILVYKNIFSILSNKH